MWSKIKPVQFYLLLSLFVLIGTLPAMADTISPDNATNLALQQTIRSTSAVNPIAFSPDGTILAAGYYDGTVKLLRVADGNLIRSMEGHSNTVYGLAFSPDGLTLASGSMDKTVKLWNVNDGSLVKTISHEDTVRSVAFSPDGNILATASLDKTIKLWKAANGSLINVLQGHTDGIYSVSFSPDGLALATASADKTIKLWRSSDGYLMNTINAHTDIARSVAFSPDGQTLASASYDKTVKIWQVSNGNLVRSLEGHTDSVYSVAFSSDGQLLASSSADGNICICRVDRWLGVKTLSSVGNNVYSVAFSPNGSMLASGSDDSQDTMKLWSISSSSSEPTDPQSISGEPQIFEAGGTIVTTRQYSSNGILISSNTNIPLRVAGGSGDAVITFIQKEGDKTYESFDRVYNFNYGQVYNLYISTYYQSWSGNKSLTVSSPNLLNDVVYSFSGASTISAHIEVPTPDYSFSPQSPKTGEEILFDAYASSDRINGISRCSWDFGDGIQGEGLVVTHTYTLAGSYPVCLSVEDQNGFKYSQTVSKDVLWAPLNQPFTLESSAYKAGQNIPIKYANYGAGGQNISIPLQWSGVSNGTKSLALLMYDLHPIADKWVHWAVVNIPTGTSSLPEGASESGQISTGSRELVNSFGSSGYGGPEPPVGSGAHEYKCILYALNVDNLSLSGEVSQAQFEAAVSGKVLGKTELSGWFSR